MSYHKAFKITLKKEGLENDFISYLKNLYDKAKENYEFYSFLELNFPGRECLRIMRLKNITREIINDELIKSYIN